MTNVSIPVPVRVAAYMLTLMPFASLVAWATAAGHLTGPAVVLVGALLSCVHTIAGALALSHLTLPDAGPSLDPSALDPSAVDVTPADVPAAVAAPSATVADDAAGADVTAAVPAAAPAVAA
jgi:hypothetical protein